MKNTYLQKLSTLGFSIIPCDKNKAPIGKWADYRKTPRTKEQVSRLDSPKYGIVTGVAGLEVIDIDTKIFTTLKDKDDFWNEFINFVSDNIDDFDEKFVIKKTISGGYHILYKCEKIQGNTKIATPQGFTQALIESRGIGGQVIFYENTISKNNYDGIKFISLEDREILWSIARTYDYKKPVIQAPPKKTVIDYDVKIGDITPWEDFNNKNNVWDIVSNDFKIVRNLNDKYIIKRHNATSVHSGYIYKNENRMFLFSTGTIYDAEKQYTPFSAYTRKNFNDDFSAAAKQAYSDGYGTRIVKKKIELQESIKIDKQNLAFPIAIFPDEIQKFILNANETLNNSIEYMCCSLLWSISVSIGNAIKIEVIPGWTENSTLWLALVGQPGWGKTPSIKRIIDPLQKLNSREVKKYYKELEKFNFYENLSKKEKEDHPEVQKPVKKQFIANDITLEALVDLHEESNNAVGVFKDELAGWFKDMNKYREGSDLEFWLSCWSGSPVILTRVTRKGSYIERPSIPVLGGIQPSVLTNFNTSENKENGFMDRILLCYPDLKSEYLSKRRIDYKTITWFNDIIVSFYETIINKIVKHDLDGEIEPLISVMSPEAFKLYDDQHRRITDQENNEEVNQYLKSMLPKQKAYIARFALIIHAFNDFFTDNGNVLLISKESMQKAIRLSEYFIENAKKVKSENIKVSEIKTVISLNKNKNNQEKFEAIYKANPEVDKKEAAEQLGVSIQMIYRYIKNLEK